MVTVSTVLALDDQENTAQEKSAGKRSRESYHTYVGSSSKRRALASLSNHVDAITERHQRNSKVSQVTYYYCERYCLPLLSSLSIQCLQTALPPSSVFDFPCSHTQITNRYVTSSMSHLTTPGKDCPTGQASSVCHVTLCMQESWLVPCCCPHLPLWPALRLLTLRI